LGARSTLYAGIEVEGRPAVVKETGGLVAWRRVSPSYFHVLGIPIIRGRGFVEQDRDPAQYAVIISGSLARRAFPNEEALGKRMRFGPQAPFRTIVGIAANVKNNPGLAGADDPEYYIPRKHDDRDASPQSAIIVRTSSRVAAADDAIRATVAAMDPALPVNVYTLEQRVNELAAGPRFNATLSGWFAVIGVLLAAVGLYGVISFLVVQRMPEIGVCLALGATPGNIFRLVFSTAARWIGAGITGGLLGSAFAARLFRTLLFKIPEHDLTTLASTVSIMLGIALLAVWLPANRASHTDPMIVLRHD
jgi:putative ABC transport system permease protein